MPETSPIHNNLTYVNSSLCVQTRTLPSVAICPFEDKEDIYVSAALREKGVWEPDVLSLFQQGLGNYPRAIVIDIGAHVGFYSLIGAKMGHAVIAVEPYVGSISRLWQGAKMNNLTDKIKAVNSGLSNDDRSYEMHFKKGNIGGTYLRETGNKESVSVQTINIGELISAKEGTQIIIKADAEGFECKALDNRYLFETTFIPYIFMEWGMMFRGRHKSVNPCQSVDLERLVRYFSGNYSAYVSRNCRSLESSWTEWRVDDIFWVHKNAPSLNCSEGVYRDQV